MRLIFSRKGFDSSSGGCPSPIFPDGSLLSLPIPDRTSPIRYADLSWRGRNLGPVVETLTRGRVRAHYRAHLDPDLRTDAAMRPDRWRPLFGQHASAQGHLRRRGVARGDLFLFWGVFRAVDGNLRWAGPPEHRIWGWLQVGEVLGVDTQVRSHQEWAWTAQHPHLAFAEDPSNTLYIGTERLGITGCSGLECAGAGAFEDVTKSYRLTAVGARTPSTWSLPPWFFPEGRPALSFHEASGRWAREENHAILKVVGRGQEFVLDLDHYSEAFLWLTTLFADNAPPILGERRGQ